MKKRSMYLETKRLYSLVRLHITSFNFAITQGLRLIVHDFFISKTLIENISKKIKIKSLSFLICKPFLNSSKKIIREFPRQSREINGSYRGDFFISILLKHINGCPERFIFKIGKIPIMIKSIKCNLNQLKSKQLIEIDEEEHEAGGYFMIKGNEKLLRLLIVPKRNIIRTFSRITNSQKGFLCTVFSSSFRSVNRVQISKTIHLHYLCNGTIHCRILLNRQEFFIPIVLLIKVLSNVTDRFIFDSLTCFDVKDEYLRKRAILMIRESYLTIGNESKNELKKFLARLLNLIKPKEGHQMIKFLDSILNDNIFVHLGTDNIKKVQLFFSMIHRLLSVQRGMSSEDNPDSFDSQELLLPGNLLMIYLREKIENSFQITRLTLDNNINNSDNSKTRQRELKNFIKRFQKELAIISRGLEFTISTGNYFPGNKNELPQTTGLSIALERTNYGRFFSFFRSIHRGKFFSEMKNTAGRKLLPQSWGFLCPVHTPDGPSCGILNHLSFSSISVISNPVDTISYEKLFFRYGKIRNFPENLKGLTIMNFDGHIFGYSSDYFLRWFVDKLRSEKVSSIGNLPKNCEFFYISRNSKKCPLQQFVFFSHDSRASRPVKWCNFKSKFTYNTLSSRNIISFRNQKNIIELIGPLEQNTLNILNFENHAGLYKKTNRVSHSEIESLGILSVIAASTPFSNLNQSPRNIYQCQMAKQSIGVPFYTFWKRNDSKIYLLLTPQVPIVRNKIVYDGLKLDSFPCGFNACISILSYSGFDMEDGIAINRSSVERGISFSRVSNCNLINTKISNKDQKKFFDREQKFNDEDGLLETEFHVSKGDPIFLKKFQENIGFKKEGFFCYNSSEKGVINQIKLSSEIYDRKKLKKALIQIRSRRRPNVGDKFASRHGQKGVLSYNFSDIDLPFSEIGIIPEILFNPNGLPSRMTIGLITEGLSGKSGSIMGCFNDASSFNFLSDRNSFGKFSEQLRQVGYQYFGSEVLYSGFSGEPLQLEMFTGIVHYQRLRHMVLDKFQISNKSPVNNLTRQPIKGRKSGGSIRFGEMERDALLGHGCTFLLHDKIQISSDLHASIFEKKVGDLFDNQTKPILKNLKKEPNQIQKKFSNRILIPYILKYLISELAVINIKLKINAEEK